MRDVKSSSGTFLNHLRLSAPGMESKAYALHDGDILQLGIDFKGGEEQIFRCVKIRVELNRAWQKSLNNFKYVSFLLCSNYWGGRLGAFSGIFGLIRVIVCLRIAEYGIWQKAALTEQRKRKTATPAQLTLRSVQSASCPWL